MNRKDFIKTIGLMMITKPISNINDISKVGENFIKTKRLPILFLGHGSPINAIEENEFVEGFRKISKSIGKVNAIICISAHWETQGTFITAMEQPRTIHDFGGFPKELFDVQYPAPGNPKLADEVKSIITKTQIELDHKWGLDHGAWSVIKHLYPNANVPVLQLSIDYTQSPQYHYELGKSLAQLRERGVLFVGSGNIVHNLRMVDWQNLDKEDYGYDWAFEANEKMKKFILEENHKELINFKNQGKSFDLSIPTPEHYIPLLYILGLKTKNENVFIFNDKAVGGALTMTSFKFI
jgi:4,5-DOPA dioxygenase extradiol